MYPFNVSRGGLDLKFDDHDRADDSKSLPLFLGSPRILPLVATTLFESITGYPGLHPIQGASLKCYLIPRPDIRSKSQFWRENTFIGVNDVVPGISRIGIRSIEVAPVNKITLSRIAIQIPPSLSEFEEKLAECIRDSFFNENLDLVTFDPEGNLSVPTVLERRLHIGFHNSFDFIHPPTIVTLQEAPDDEHIENGLQFLGNIKLDNFFADDPTVSLVAMIEYKVQIKIRGKVEPKGEFTKFIERFTSPKGGTAEELSYGIERLVNVGWSAIHIPNEKVYGHHKIVLNEGYIPNPFPAYMYHAFNETYREQDNDVAEVKKKVKQKLLPLSLLFTISDTDIINRKRTVVAEVKTEVAAQKEEVKVEPTQAQKIVQEEEKVERVEAPYKDIEEDKNDPEEIKELLIPKMEPDFLPFPTTGKRTGKSVLSRAEKARLLSAGFEIFHDEDGQKLPAVDPDDCMQNKSDFKLEINDSKSNEIIFQIMGISFNENFKHRNSGRLPNAISFSFQFFTFPNLSTENYKVYFGALPPVYQLESGHQRTASTPVHQRQWSQMSKNSFYSEQIAKEESIQWPGILYKVEEDGRPTYDKPPGATLRFVVDSQNGNVFPNWRYGATSFPYYLDQKQLHIDVWDGDSLLHMGTACLDLKPLLRQGKSGVQYDDDIDIMWTEVRLN
jgi:nephrocystin-4